MVARQKQHAERPFQSSEAIILAESFWPHLEVLASGKSERAAGRIQIPFCFL